MAIIQIEITEIPHGHGLSFKKGVADGLLDSQEHKQTIDKTNSASYKRGLDAGIKLKIEIAKLVKS